MKKHDKVMKVLMSKGWNYSQSQYIIETSNISEKILANFK